jgi:hypothetical protein
MAVNRPELNSRLGKRAVDKRISDKQQSGANPDGAPCRCLQLACLAHVGALLANSIEKVSDYRNIDHEHEER